MKKYILVFILIFLLSGCSKLEYEMILHEGNDYIEIYTHDPDLLGCTMSTEDSYIDMDLDSENVDVNTLGTYTVTYSTVVSGDKYFCNRVMYVVDSTGPTVELNPGYDIISIGTDWVDEGVTVSDNYDETSDLTVEVDDSKINVDVAGYYEVKYIVKDTSNNITIRTRIVQIIE